MMKTQYDNVAAICAGNGQLHQFNMTQITNTLDCMHDQQIILIESENQGGNLMPEKRYRVRRLTPTECARLQGFPDNWGHPEPKETMTQQETDFWNAVRRTRAAMDGKQSKDMTPEQTVKWYAKLHTDSSEYKMWGNAIAIPNAAYVLGRVAMALRGEPLDIPSLHS